MLIIERNAKNHEIVIVLEDGRKLSICVKEVYRDRVLLSFNNKEILILTGEKYETGNRKDL